MIAQSATTAQYCVRCRRCGRALKNPKAIAVKMGTVCQRKSAAGVVAFIARVEAAPATADRCQSLVAIALALAPMPTVPATALAAAPVDAAPALRAKVRQSRQFPSLTTEFRPTAYGVYLVFNFAGVMSAYAVEAGTARLADCSDRGVMPNVVESHCRDFARELAVKLAAKAVA